MFYYSIFDVNLRVNTLHITLEVLQWRDADRDTEKDVPTSPEIREKKLLHLLNAPHFEDLRISYYGDSTRVERLF